MYNTPPNTLLSAVISGIYSVFTGDKERIYSSSTTHLLLFYDHYYVEWYYLNISEVTYAIQVTFQVFNDNR